MLTQVAQKATKRDYLVTIEGIPGTWRSFSGAGATASVTKDYDGGARRYDNLAGPVEYDDIEVVRTVAPTRDDAWIKTLRTLIGIGAFTVTKQYITPAGMKVGAPTTYPACLLVGLQEAESDASSSDAAEVTLTLATSGPA